MFWKIVVLYEIYSKKLVTEYFLYIEDKNKFNNI
jgi:hypothetical protein